MSLEWLNAVAVIVLGGVLVAAVAGVVLMYRQVGELRVALVHIAETLEQMTAQTAAERREAREDNARIHLRIDDLVKRPSV